MKIQVVAVDMLSQGRERGNTSVCDRVSSAHYHTKTCTSGVLPFVYHVLITYVQEI